MMPKAKWTANLEIDGFCIQIGSKILKFLIFAQLSPTQKYIYTWWISKIFGFLKSYESEKLENHVYVLRGYGLTPSPEKT